jgi:hypothetical protein
MTEEKKFKKDQILLALNKIEALMELQEQSRVNVLKMKRYFECKILEHLKETKVIKSFYCNSLYEEKLLDKAIFDFRFSNLKQCFIERGDSCHNRKFSKCLKSDEFCKFQNKENTL